MIQSHALRTGLSFVPDAGEPALALIVGNGALGDELDGGVGDVVAEKRVVGGDVIGAHGAAHDGVLFLTGEGGVELAFDDHVAVGQHINDADGHLRGDGFLVVDLAAAVEFVVRIIFIAGKMPFLVNKPLAAGAVKKAGDAGVHRGFLGGRGVVVARGAVVFLDDDGENVADGVRLFIGEHGRAAEFRPSKANRAGGGLPSMAGRAAASASMVQSRKR